MEEKSIIRNDMNAVNDDSLNILDMLMLCLRHWRWFVLSVSICMCFAAYKLLSTQKTYTRTMWVQVKNTYRSSDDVKSLEALGVTNLRSDANDEVVIIHSPSAIYDLVKRLHLDMRYERPGLFRNNPLYGVTLPAEVVMHDISDNDVASFRMKLNGDKTATLSEIVFKGQEIEGEVTLEYGVKTPTPMGNMTITPTIGFPNDFKDEILVTRIPYISAAGIYGGRISAEQFNKETKNIIIITCVDNCIPRAENVLSTLVNIYNENWIQNRNQVTVATNQFIQERLSVIEKELGNVDTRISNYKSANVMPDVTAVAGQAMAQETAADQLRQELNNELYMVRFVRSYVADPSHNHQLLPAGSGINNTGIESQIAAYNTQLLQRNNLVANSSEQNPLVKDLDIALSNMKMAIITSLDNAQTTLTAQLNNAQAQHNQAIAKLSANPTQANHLLSIERQQKVKESLYLFLLQKREENELSQTFTAYNTRVIAEPFGSYAPSSPNSRMIILIALAIGIAIPAAYFILMEQMNTKVRGRHDLESLTIPYVGELPKWKPKKGEEVSDGYKVVVKQHSRDITNEAFRVVRTNLEFMTNAEKKNRIVMVTSFNPGSGKTFITGNLATSFGIRGSKVICLDLDLRRASLSEFVNSPKQGLSDYLSGHNDDYKSLITQIEGTTVNVLPVGKIPPNPTELLYSPRLQKMLDELREQYDYVFVDCPPVEIVADATIINHAADVTLFIVRAGLLDRSMLPELEKSYQEKKYNNMAILLNGTDAEHHYGYHRYGYGYGRYGYSRYGYSYGKSYGYGYYGSSSKKEKKDKK